MVCFVEWLWRVLEDCAECGICEGVSCLCRIVEGVAACAVYHLWRVVEGCGGVHWVWRALEGCRGFWRVHDFIAVSSGCL